MAISFSTIHPHATYRTAVLGGLFSLTFLLGCPSARQQASTGESSGQPSVGDVLEIVGPTLDGGNFDLNDYRGKVVLVDFWATWCGPCVAELPNVRSVYDKYHEDGFEVVGVSLDESREDLAEFLESHDEPWPQIIFDEEGKVGGSNPLAKKYGVYGIPYMVVVDREGKVVATDVRGRDIEAAVAKALGK